jgi:hypothetical protein
MILALRRTVFLDVERGTSGFATLGSSKPPSESRLAMILGSRKQL